MISRWPVEAFPDALAALGPRPAAGDSTDPIALAVAAGHDPVPVEWSGRPTAGLVRQVAPGWCRVPGGVVVVRRVAGPWVQVVGRDGRRWTSAAAVAALIDPAENAGLLGFPELRARRGRAAAVALAGGRPVADGTCVRLRPGPAASTWRRLADERVVAPLLVTAALVVLGYLAVVAAWAAAGSRLLEPGADAGWVGGWLVVAGSGAVARVGAQGALATAAVRLSTWWRRRLGARAVRLDPDAVFRAGPGWVLGRTFDVEAAESGVTAGGAAAVVGVAELAVAAGLCVIVAPPLLLGLAAFVAVGALCARAAIARKRSWAAARRAIGTRMAEELIVHPGRLVQGRPAGDAERTAAELLESERAAAGSDRVSAGLVGGFAPAWLLLGLLILLGLPGTGRPADLAAGLGVVLLAAGGVEALALAWDDLSDGLVALSDARALLDADHPPAVVSPRAPDGPLVSAANLSVRYPGAARPALTGFGISIGAGDRVLLGGPSGVGKSTAVAALAGLVAPDSGRVHRTGRVLAVPQIHRNHMFASTLAFNLLLGRDWPPTPADLADAERLCRDLDLGPLLDRMPAGLNQLVGETGWQLSDGERARVYAARALLQRADLVLLDESLAALDPLTAAACRDAIARHARAVLLTHHP